MFDSLSEKLEAAFRRLRRKGVLSEADVREAVREVRLALLEADVNFKVVKEFLAKVEARAVGQEILASLTPDQEVVRVVRDELSELMGRQPARVTMASNPPTVIYLVGLQGSGKTTTAAKLARMLKDQGRLPLLVAADIYRPAAVDQLRTLASQLDVPVYYSEGANPVELAVQGVAQSRKLARDVLIIDTAGRLHIDEGLMAELEAMEKKVPAHETLLVVDAMTGQDAVRVTESFRQRLPLTGVVLTKLDGDARGGAALSIRAVTGLPIKLITTGEKLDALEAFQPERMASRILGMGDVLSLIEKAELSLDRAETEDLAKRVESGDFSLEEFRAMLQQVKRLGPLSKVMEMIPGMGAMGKLKNQIDDKSLVRVEAILSSMTPLERRRPKVLDGSRRLRIARGSGTTVQEVNRLLKQFQEMQKVMRQVKGMRKGKRGVPKLPFPPMP
ncbi:MAG: signal recognition particle protein [Firmicutes bacterium]|jgi:signal recognition particle subunit SRP54|nr:signal recognition particle protein [Bacillota bacterium]